MTEPRDSPQELGLSSALAALTSSQGKPATSGRAMAGTEEGFSQENQASQQRLYASRFAQGQCFEKSIFDQLKNKSYTP